MIVIYCGACSSCALSFYHAVGMKEIGNLFDISDIGPHYFMYKKFDYEWKKINSERAQKQQALSTCSKSRKLIVSFRGWSEKIWTNRYSWCNTNENGEIEKYNIEKQCHSVFENIRFILEDAGSSWENIVDVQVFLTNMKDDFKTYNKIYRVF